MSNDQRCCVQTDKKSDGKWYYVVVVDGETGVLMGPHDTEDEALAAGQKELENLGICDDEE
ncbi:hypothetical protein [Phyllobacterium sp. YR531]|uniref:SPOR domain-containing protein n=1 Tax=Phyllobacterium sp. YR531 TaxID=1144343 RepID=UPI00026F491C|nr:hypothetical protein [Phyllobacterium sp. YR531]EJN05565.1 hypothetical protein PMI41_00771 [Phyllobacterium sp. YR531]